MDWIQRVIQTFLPAAPHAADGLQPRKVRGSGDPVVDLTETVCRIAEAAAGLDANLVEEEIAKYVAGSLNAQYYAQATKVGREAFAESAKAVHADQQHAVAEDAAQYLVEEMDRIASERGVRQAHEQVAEAEIDERLAVVDRLPLIEKVKTSWPLALVAMAATSAGVGTLARLSLESVSDTSARTLVTIAAVGGAFASELVIGTLGAETYDRIPAERRRRALLIVLGVLVVALIGTEVLAALARQAGVSGTNAFSIDPTTGQPKVSGAFTPSLLWTGPLAILVTLTGSGVVGLARLRETSKPTYDGLAIARARLAEARKALRDDERRVEQLREQATATRGRAAELRAQSSTASANGERLVSAMDQLSKRHAELIAAVTAQAILEYRIAAANLLRNAGKPEASPAASYDPARRLSTVVGLSGVAGATTGLATTSVAFGAVAAAAVLVAATLRTV